MKLENRNKSMQLNIVELNGDDDELVKLKRKIQVP